MSLGPFNHQTLLDLNSIDAEHYAEDSYTKEEIDEFIKQDLPEYGPNKRHIPYIYHQSGKGFYGAMEARNKLHLA